MCRRRRLKFNSGKNKVMVKNGDERLECEIHVDGICLEHVSEFKFLGCVFWMNQVQIRQNMVRRWQVGGGWQVLLGP